MGYSAAEIERYTYCPLSWHLSREGHHGRDEALRKGIESHEAKGDAMSKWQRVLADHKESLRTAFHLALVAASAATLAIEVTFLDATSVANRVLMLLSLFWLLVSLGFLLRAMRRQQEAQEVVSSAGLVQGELTYSDLDRPGDVLRCEKYDVGGKPDYIVKRDGHLIPVEVKTGQTPDHPHDSHVMQLATYCVLVEECYQQRPPSGIISYEKKQFEIPYTEELKDKVLETILRMRLAEMTGNVHRNHNRVGKCRGCSRREMCPERLA